MITDFTPRPRSATLARRARSQAGIEARLMLRNGEQLLLALVIPLLVLIGGVYALNHSTVAFTPAAIDLLTPGVIALAVMSTAFTSLAIATGFERRAGLLRRLAVSPLGWQGLLVGKIGAVLIVQAVQVLVIAVVALVMGWAPAAVGLAYAIPIGLAGTAAFAGLGLTLAGTLRAEATLAMANLINLLLMVGGGIVLGGWPFADTGGWVHWLPSAALGDALRSALIDAHFDARAMAILVGWGAIGAAAAARWFRWD
jgi:ABC-2 type transport system permease protein